MNRILSGGVFAPARERLMARRLILVLVMLLAFPLIRVLTGLNAAEVAPPGGFPLQTNGPDAAIGLGDWYTSDDAGAGGGYHYLTITVPCGWPSGTDIHVDLFSPEMNESALGARDEIGGATLDDTEFELYGPGTSVGPGFDMPAPGTGFVTATYSPVPSPTPESWVRFHTLTAPVACGGYVLRSEVKVDDQNGWRLRVGSDDDSDPNNAPPANSDNPDGLVGTNDEIIIGLDQVTFQQDTGSEGCQVFYQYVPPGQSSTTFHNFDMDLSGRVRYYAPSDTLDPFAMTGGVAGTVSPDAGWNPSSGLTRDGDVVSTTESGWWRIVTCISSHNQIIQEGETAVATFYSQPPTPDVTVTKSDSVSSVAPGNQTTYVITATNSDAGASPGAANEVGFTDTVPTNTSFVDCGFVGPATGSCSESGGIVTYDLSGWIDAGDSALVTMTVRVNDSATGTVTNDVEVSYEDALGNPFPAVSATDVDTVVNSPPVAEDDSDATLPDTPVTVTVLANDSDPDDNLDPSSVTVTVAPGDGVATVNPDGTITYDPDPAFTGFDTFTYEVCDFGGLCDTATVTVQVDLMADLSITKTDSPDPVLAGNQVTYTVVVTNAGPSDGETVTVSDSLPEGFTASTVSSSQGGCVSLPCDLGTLVGGSSATVTIVADVASSTPAGTYVDTASVTTTTDDPDPSNNSTSEDTTVVASADLSITKTDAPDPVIAGNQVTYTIEVANAGPSDGETVTVSDTLPSGFTTSTVSSSQGGCSSLPCDLGTLTSGATATVTVVADVDPATPAGTYTDTASVTSVSPDPDPSNDTATEDTEVIEESALTLTKADDPDPVTAGGQVTYTVSVSNAGPSLARNVVVDDVLPPGFTVSSVSSSQGGCTAIPCSLGDITVNTTETVTIVVDVPPSQVPGVYTDVATATSDNSPDAATTEDTAVVASADLMVTKSDDPDPVFAGNQVTYTVVATNNGPSDAQAVVVDDTLPAIFATTTVSSSQGDCVSLPCLAGTVPAGTSVTVTIVGGVDPSTPAGTYIDTATVTSTTTDQDPSNNSTTEETTVVVEADVLVTKIDSPDPVIAGEQITYTVTVENLGPSTAETVTVTDTIPTGTSYVSDTGGCSESGGVVTCPLGSMGPGDTEVFEVVVDVAKLPDGTILTNGVTVTATTTDPDSTNNSSSVTTTVVAPVIGLTKSADPPEGTTLTPGQQITYTITYSNTGSTTATAFTVTDTVHPLLGMVRPFDGGTFDPGPPRVVTWIVGDVGPSVTDTVSFRARVGSTPQPTFVTNTAWAIANEIPEPVQSNETRHRLSVPDVLLTKSSVPSEGSELKADELVTYSLTIQNLSSVAALGAVVKDTPPSSMVYQANTTRLDGALRPDVAGTSPLFGAGVTFDIAARSTRVVTFQMRLAISAKAGALIENFASVTWNDGTSTSGDFHVLRVLTPTSGPKLTQTILIEEPSGRLVFVTLFDEVLDLITQTGYPAALVLLLGLASLGIGRSFSLDTGERERG